jgi:hypothetical protein
MSLGSSEEPTAPQSDARHEWHQPGEPVRSRFLNRVSDLGRMTECTSWFTSQEDRLVALTSIIMITLDVFLKPRSTTLREFA